MITQLAELARFFAVNPPQRTPQFHMSRNNAVADEPLYENIIGWERSVMASRYPRGQDLRDGIRRHGQDRKAPSQAFT